MNRLYNLDYLRGFAAFGIMMYHYLSWTFGSFTADSFMGRVAIYGVSVFYILSGLTLYYVYYERMRPSKDDLISFFKKRVLRIFPLLWLVTFASILLSGKIPDIGNLFLNLTGLFGFIRWDKYFSAGVWSIGNELVFYAFFPVFVLFIKRFKPLMLVFSFVLFGIYLYFTFVKLTPSMTIGEQWNTFTNPLNQVFLFLGGFLVGAFLHKMDVKNSVIVSVLLVALTLFIFFPATGDIINLVTGTNRLIFTASSFLICICFYKLTFKFPKFIHNPLTFLGEASYSVYLVHPIVWALTTIAIKKYNIYFPDLPKSGRFIIAVISTLVISHFVYQYFEKYFMKLGHSSKNNPS